MDTQLTKQELKELNIGDKICEKFWFESYIWEIYRKEIDEERNIVTLYLKEGKTKTKLIISDNFNKEGDRKYKSFGGNIIVKYYIYGNNK